MDDERKNKNYDFEKTHYLAYHDNITGLNNEKYFFKELNKRIKERNGTEKIIILYLKFNNFVDFSNIIGFENSNKFIKKMGDVILDSSLKIEEMSVFNGNQFLILLSMDKDNIYERLKNQTRKFLFEIKEYLTEINFDYLLKVNIGISVFPDHAEKPQGLLSKAQHAMYLVDKRKNNYKIYNKKLFIDKVEFESLHQDLIQAINNEDLFLEFQPKVNTYSERIVSFEALIRWNHCNKGIIQPDEFISIAEKTGMIKKIGVWVLDQTFKQLEEWEKIGFDDIVISINMSEIELNDPNIIKIIKKISSSYSIANKKIEFEITERSFKEVSTDVMNELKRMGFLISLDDFGTGYSSLSYFGKSPFDLLKLDKIFIDNIYKEKSRLIVESVINLAHKFDVKVIAEGVETKEQLEILRKIECDYIQGYYFYKPMSASKITVILNNLKKNSST
ncbi:diguanylate cyclase/phosphodiesterase (GGDEF & EAL domains) with PAS/PAC sensor(s) [Halanaerobium saccharolyticum subsp. saccharolyticum DSM 6643]|uniref:Diguanylate cyclase/phosphodiesterase (GGDEF & EAL domains) with PAS/PAC sensor(S) n=1 Tax=Halanaerobium saccharolyticum subsp. saccharolyticum DSM 6643 TaxID=1293054 RepID=M5E1Y4_9FIRM|nr:GGDEF domain-containing phosphodiesterase [Halanaerobium saccharolyticum]CCU80486.1 diguanylate cyclase/phosphodiesterase (GGDEF & EAL domains) with PAS/PAC sensor(s) [Halanaerobium saccharolyticum subsp. saccharolyticum DSM 6643]